ncbi:hypothetical protein AMTR_s00026p00122450 [Amborella trichopoda]|uniref:Uncharacterized protein n=1 Tax=Amborella trichopoda TaxID=13333 RepID=W1PSY3_AMBTC|nr:hypothetical protein AMTR_s00026p00122450 [Amborella trichopoda]
MSFTEARFVATMGSGRGSWLNCASKRGTKEEGCGSGCAGMKILTWAGKVPMLGVSGGPRRFKGEGALWREAARSRGSAVAQDILGHWIRRVSGLPLAFFLTTVVSDQPESLFILGRTPAYGMLHNLKG